MGELGAFGPAGRARGVEDVEGVGGLDRDAAGGVLGAGAHHEVPVEVAALDEVRLELGTLLDDHGGRLVVVQPKADLTPDVAALEAAITPRTRVILVNSPNNPSGVIYPASAFVAVDTSSLMVSPNSAQVR